MKELKVACRSLLRRPTLSGGVVLTLALGIGATTAVYGVVDGVVLRPLPYDDASRLVTVGSVPPGAGGVDPATGLHNLAPMTSVDYYGLLERARSFQVLTAVGGHRVTVSDENGLDEFVAGASVGPDFFEMLGVTPALGRTFLPEEFEFPEELGETFGNAALITHGYWQRRYGGDPDLLGRPLEPGGAGAAAALVVGILPEGYQPPEPFFASDELPEVYTPMRLPPTDGPVRMVRGGLRALALLQPGVTVEEARTEVAAVATEIASPFPPGTAPASDDRRSLGVNGLHSETVGTTASTLWVFLGAAGLLLLLAAMNAASLLLARALDRGQELGVRAALGAGRGRLVRLLLYEAGVLTAAGTVLGTLAAFVGIEAFHRLAPVSIPRLAAVVIDGRVLAATAAVSVVTGLAAGLLPAFQLTRRRPWERLRTGGRTISRPGLGLRAFLVGGQLALAVVLLSGAGLLFNSFMRLRASDPGFEVEGLLAMSATPVEGVRIRLGEIGEFWTRWDPVLAELRSIPGVDAVAGASTLPFQAPTWAPRVLLPDDEPEAVREGIAGYVVTPGYFGTMGTELLRGRAIASSDGPDGERVVVVNEAFVRTQMGDVDPLNTMLRRATEGPGATGEIVPMRIVGVVRDVVQTRLEDGARPAIYVPYTQADLAQLTQWSQVVRVDALAGAVVPEVRRRLSELAQIPDDLGTMESRVSVALTAPRFRTTLIGAFGAVAMLLAAMGLYGSLAENVRRLRREIGIRMALGADGPALVRMVFGQGMRLTAAGLAAGLLGTLALSGAVASFLYEVVPYDPPTLAVVAGMLIAVAAAACTLPARRATKLDPVAVLKSE